jgi:hypothetical protein
MVIKNNKILLMHNLHGRHDRNDSHDMTVMTMTWQPWQDWHDMTCWIIKEQKWYDTTNITYFWTKNHFSWIVRLRCMWGNRLKHCPRVPNQSWKSFPSAEFRRSFRLGPSRSGLSYRRWLIFSLSLKRRRKWAQSELFSSNRSEMATCWGEKPPSSR